MAKEYNPWLNGDASWFNHKYEFDDGLKVEINTGLSLVVVNGIYEPESEYVFQGDEADDLVFQICEYWHNNRYIGTDEAVHYIINHL